MILNIFRRAHPFIFNTYSVIIPSIITFMILAVFTPFQFAELEFKNRIFIAIVTAILVALAIVFTALILKAIFPKWMDADRWTLGREVLLFLLMFFAVAVTIFLGYSVLFDVDDQYYFKFPQFALITILIGALPVTISILFEQFQYQKQQLNEVSRVNEQLKFRNIELRKNRNQEVQSAFPLTIKSESGTLILKLKTSDLILIKSDGNYLEVHFKKGNSVERKVIRNRMKSIEEKLPQNSFFRCHNSYIINIKEVVKLEGNSRNLSLQLKQIDWNIPVSRSKVKAISSFLNEIR